MSGTQHIQELEGARTATITKQSYTGEPPPGAGHGARRRGCKHKQDMVGWERLENWGYEKET